MYFNTQHVSWRRKLRVGCIQSCLRCFWVVGDYGSWESGDSSSSSNAWHYFHLCDSAQAAAALFDILMWNKQPAAHWLTLISESCLYLSLFLPPSCVRPFFLVITLIGLVCYPAAPHSCQGKVVQLSADITYCTAQILILLNGENRVPVTVSSKMLKKLLVCSDMKTQSFSISMFTHCVSHKGKSSEPWFI